MDNLRCYHFNNFYFSGVHAGIQSHHSFMEIFNKYKYEDTSPQMDMLNDWAENYKTVIVLNGGMQVNLEEMEAFLSKDDNPFGWASFREAKMAANEALTSVGVILPDHIFKMSRKVVNSHPKVLAARGIGDGLSFKSDELEINIIEGGVEVSYTPLNDGFSLITPVLGNPFKDDFSLEKHVYSDFEVELMARMSMCSLMS
jgi:hypothetical protein